MTYNVSTQVSVQVADSEADASKTGAQNVVGLTNNTPGSDTGRPNSLGTFLRGQDTGSWSYNLLFSDKNHAAHEFGHLLGVGDRHKGAFLMNTDLPVLPDRATASDFGWGIRCNGSRSFP